jgi:hypothetical protein
MSLSHQPIHSGTKRGRLIESGDKKKDAERKAAMEKLPIVGQAPKWVTRAVTV